MNALRFLLLNSMKTSEPAHRGLPSRGPQEKVRRGLHLGPGRDRGGRQHCLSPEDYLLPEQDGAPQVPYA